MGHPRLAGRAGRVRIFFDVWKIPTSGNTGQKWGTLLEISRIRLIPTTIKRVQSDERKRNPCDEPGNP